MADYDIGAAFGEIEDELISSMVRNLKRHQVEEVTEGIEWAQWQALQLQALEDYKRKAAQKFGSKFSTINDRVEEMLTDTYNTAETAQEQKILKAIQKGIPETATPITGSGAIQGEFFKTNDRKLDALIKATTSDMEKAEHAVLRMTDDKYRKIIFNAQVYANTGAGTYAKAVDMATKDFLSAGINCIEYKNGRRVNIKSYAEMAIRTANKRAYLQGEGEMRKEWGIHTVILNKRVNACPKCSPFVGKVIVDDVWSGGTAEEAEKSGYLLMSDCIKQGLYHPNCQDSHTTYFGDILDDEDEEDTGEQEQTEEEPAETELEEDEVGQGEGTEEAEEITETFTPEEHKRNIELYNAEQRQNYCERQVQRFERMSKYSLDKDNQRIYRVRKSEWKEKLERIKESVQKFKKSVAISAESGIINTEYVLARKERNTGAFSELEIPMQKRYVLYLCQKYGIDTNGIKFKIQRSEELVNLGYFGMTDYDNIGRIDLLPNAFRNEEQLLRTIIHEKCHVKQLKKYGKKYVQDNLDEMERVAYKFEDFYYSIVKRRTNL